MTLPTGISGNNVTMSLIDRLPTSTRLLRRGLGCALAVLALAASPRPALAVQAIEDHLPQFLTAVGDGSVDYWMAFEAANSKELDEIFYRDRSTAQKEVLARQALAHYVPVRQLDVFANRWRADFEWVSERVEALSGRLPYVTVSIAHTGGFGQGGVEAATGAGASTSGASAARAGAASAVARSMPGRTSFNKGDMPPFYPDTCRVRGV